MDVRTSVGRVPLTGKLSEDRSRPVLLVIRGIFHGDSYGQWLVAEFAGQADVLLAHVPGMNSPTLAASDLATMGQAFREVVEGELADRDVIVFGMSTGCLIALAMGRLPQVRRMVLLDPYLNVADCWALRELIGVRAKRGTVLRAWFEALLGQGLEGDFRELIAARAPRTYVLVGEEPLEPMRALNKIPSLASAQEREMWAAAPGVELTVCAGAGHDIPREALRDMLATLNRALAEA
jgi:pimeloyl-ACP methyl ester carboxylesterase